MASKRSIKHQKSDTQLKMGRDLDHTVEPTKNQSKFLVNSRNTTSKEKREMASKRSHKHQKSETQLKVRREFKDKSPMTWTSTQGLPKWRQSPIDLPQFATSTVKVPPLQLINYWPKDSACVMTNTGQTVRIEFEGESQPIMRGGPFKDDYQFKNLQFRWGADNVRGAEHSIDGTWYSMEAQLLHWNTRYNTYEKCFEKLDGIGILSFPIQVVGCAALRDNPEMSFITDNLRKIRRAGKKTTIPYDSLKWMGNACGSPGYYIYPGSLTVPPYTECVIWIVTPSMIKLSINQIDEFRCIYNRKMEHIVENSRSLQKLHRRRIIYATEDAFA